MSQGMPTDNGSPGTGITPPAGGRGILGFLSGLFAWTKSGQRLMATSAPVVLASDQSTIPISAAALPLPAGASTAALQTTGNTSLSSIDGKLATLGQKPMAGSTPVVIASDQSAVPISTASLPLPAGAATAALQSTVQSAPGTPQTAALSVQGNAAGVPVPVNSQLQSGTWNYVAATLTGAGTVTGVGRCIGIRVFASAADATFNINGGNTIMVRSNTSIEIDPHGNLSAPVINWVSGTLDAFIEGVS